MMRFILLAALLLAAGCPARPPEERPAPARNYEVRKEGVLVLSVSDRPGPLVSSAAPPPGMRPVHHPFLSAVAHVPAEEHALRGLLDASKDFPDFLERLRKAGYEVTERP